MPQKTILVPERVRRRSPIRLRAERHKPHRATSPRPAALPVAVVKIGTAHRKVAGQPRKSGLLLCVISLL
jgi:hypothetical protein